MGRPVRPAKKSLAAKKTTADAAHLVLQKT
jgi:hypothetical protein